MHGVKCRLDCACTACRVVNNNSTSQRAYRNFGGREIVYAGKLKVFKNKYFVLNVYFECPNDHDNFSAMKFFSPNLFQFLRKIFAVLNIFQNSRKTPFHLIVVFGHGPLLTTLTNPPHYSWDWKVWAVGYIHFSLMVIVTACHMSHQL